MASLIDIRRRLRSIKNTQQITKAMKMVAAARLRRAQDRVVGARPYSRLLSNVLAAVAARSGEAHHPLLETREEKRVILVVLAADRGLCGAFNTNVNRATSQLLSTHREWQEVRILPVGRKAVEFWRRRRVPFTEKVYPGIFASLQYGHAKEIASFLSEEFLSHRVDAVYIVVNEFRSVLSQVVRTVKLLPLSTEMPSPGKESTRREYITEPDPQTILAWLLPRYLEFTVFLALLESSAAEMAARMTAMDSASKNAGELIDKLTLTYNRARQARITKELIEIVSGAAALG
ncbi:MAG TPA: ATP synthase F1 subunit gamma [Thermoanaerobaculia bacterium]|jgi:F-type H+-transporting ATPase subunit gamma